jgi:hypothetical protein
MERFTSDEILWQKLGAEYLEVPLLSEKNTETIHIWLDFNG